jgi:hypothetical protein
MPLTLLIPDLLPPADAPDAMRGLRLPALEKWLARADGRREAGTGTAWLLRQWGLGADAPVAALTLAADGGPRDGTWVRADPVHQRVDRHALVLHDASVLDLTRDEADAAIEALNAFFGDDGLMFAAPAVDRWYIRVPADEMPVTFPLESAVGRNPFGMLPSGGTHLKWCSIFSEAQMLLSALPFNVQRESQGRPALNAVWFWGGGALPANLPRPFAEVAASETLARSLALASDCATMPLPDRLASLASRESNTTLVVIDTLRDPLRRGDVDAWRASATRVERHWFTALGDALPRFGRIRIVLPSERDTAVFDLDGRAPWRIFRRPRALASHA